MIDNHWLISRSIYNLFKVRLSFIIFVMGAKGNGFPTLQCSSNFSIKNPEFVSSFHIQNILKINFPIFCSSLFSRPVFLYSNKNFSRYSENRIAFFLRPLLVNLKELRNASGWYIAPPVLRFFYKESSKDNFSRYSGNRIYSLVVNTL